MSKENDIDFCNIFDKVYVKEVYKSRYNCVRKMFEILSGEKPPYSMKTLSGFSYRDPIDEYAYNLLYNEETDKIEIDRLKVDEFRKYLFNLPEEHKTAILYNCFKDIDNHNEYKEFDKANFAEKFSRLIKVVFLKSAMRKDEKIRHCQDNKDIQLSDSAGNKESIHGESNTDTSKGDERPAISANVNTAKNSKHNDRPFQAVKYDLRNIDNSTTITNTHTEETTVNTSNYYTKIEDNRKNIFNITQINDQKHYWIKSIIIELNDLVESLYEVSLRIYLTGFIKNEAEKNKDKEEYDNLQKQFDMKNKELRLLKSVFPSLSEVIDQTISVYYTLTFVFHYEKNEDDKIILKGDDKVDEYKLCLDKIIEAIYS